MYDYSIASDYGDMAVDAGKGLGFGLGAAFFTFLMVFILIMLLICAFCIIVKWKMFVKAGKPGWASIIPVYSTIVMLEIIGYKWYYIFFFLLGSIPIIGQAALLLFNITLNLHLAKSFGQSKGFGVGLLLISPVFIAIIAFKNDIKYIGPTVNGDIDFNDLF